MNLPGKAAATDGKNIQHPTPNTQHPMDLADVRQRHRVLDVHPRTALDPRDERLISGLFLRRLVVSSAP
jgi:hypothetical protein